MASIPCAQCGSKCCKYIALPIDTPSSAQEVDYIKWYLLHKNVKVFISTDDIWHIEFVTPCTMLGKDGRCTTYESRPDICRVYGSEDDADECEYFENPYKECFTSVEDFERFYRRWRNRKRK